jgi:hypothetical protein
LLLMLRRLLRCLLFSLRDFLAAGHKFLVTTLVAAGGAGSAADDVDDNLAVVLAAGRAGTVWKAKCSAFTAGGTNSLQSVVTPAFCCLRAVPPHSDYHRGLVYVFP